MIFIYFPSLSFARSLLWAFIFVLLASAACRVLFRLSAPSHPLLPATLAKEVPAAHIPSAAELGALAARVCADLRTTPTSLTAIGQPATLAQLALIFYKAGAVFQKITVRPSGGAGLYEWRACL